MIKKRRGALLGAALDIGTNDIKGALLDISSARQLASGSTPNEQKAFGQDVITRLYSAVKKDGMERLNKALISALNKLLTRLAREASVSKDDIKRIIAVGNTTMYHLALMIDPSSLAEAPFTPKEKALQERNARGLGIEAAKDAVFKFLPNIGGFAGSDILAAILAAGIYRDKKYGAIMDIGTNGEIALGSGNKIFVTSCASGPAFEGRHIACGMPAAEGAIIRAKFRKGRFYFKTVGNAPPKGIGGSGLIDIISIMLDRRLIDRKGRMRKDKIAIYKDRRKEIYLTQGDVRELQLAKAALRSGIEILMKKAKIGHADLNRFYITGTFGVGIDVGHAGNIGLIPDDIPPAKVIFLKNAALSGAKIALLEPACEEEINGILAKCRHVELHKDEGFEAAFAGSMYF